jgi:hypothetical protein
MHKDLRRVYWWPGVKKDVTRYMRTSLSRQKVKAKHKKIIRLLQKLSIPLRKREEVAMDFVTRLPSFQTKKDAIWVVDNKLVESALFIPVNMRNSMEKLTRIYT